MLKTIFFDFDGVLTTDPSGWFTTCKNLGAILPGVSFDRIAECYKKKREDLNFGRIEHKEMWEEFCSCVGSRLEIDVLNNAFANTPRNERMFDLCKKLKKTYTLGIITDNNRERFRLLEKTMALDNLFPIRILSADVGAMKDSRLIFDKALEAAGCAPEECAFIDNQEHNLTVPREMGFKTFWYDLEKNHVGLFVNWLTANGVDYH